MNNLNVTLKLDKNASNSHSLSSVVYVFSNELDSITINASASQYAPTIELYNEYEVLLESTNNISTPILSAMIKKFKGQQTTYSPIIITNTLSLHKDTKKSSGYFYSSRSEV